MGHRFSPMDFRSVFIGALSVANALNSLLSRRDRGDIMATSQRLTDGFHQLGIVLAAIPLVLGVAWTALTPVIYSDVIPHALTGIAGTFAASLAVYGIVRAIGWVIGGFVAS